MKAASSILYTRVMLWSSGRICLRMQPMPRTRRTQPNSAKANKNSCPKLSKTIWMSARRFAASWSTARSGEVFSRLAAGAVAYASRSIMPRAKLTTLNDRNHPRMNSIRNFISSSSKSNSRSSNNSKRSRPSQMIKKQRNKMIKRKSKLRAALKTRLMMRIRRRSKMTKMIRASTGTDLL